MWAKPRRKKYATASPNILTYGADRRFRFLLFALPGRIADAGTRGAGAFEGVIG